MFVGIDTELAGHLVIICGWVCLTIYIQKIIEKIFDEVMDQSINGSRPKPK